MHISNESLLVILVVGLVAGWLAGKIVQGAGFGLIGELALHPVIACQRWINSVLMETAEVSAAGLLMPPKVALTAVATLMRHSIVASDGLISRRVAYLATTPAAKGISLPEVEPVKSPTSAFAALADHPALFGVAAALAVDVLTAPSLSAAADPAERILASTEEMPWSARRRGIAATRSPLLDAILLRQSGTDNERGRQAVIPYRGHCSSPSHRQDRGMAVRTRSAGLRARPTRAPGRMEARDGPADPARCP